MKLFAMKLFATMLLVLMTLPCVADETAINKAVAIRVYEEGLSRGIFTVPYTDDFVRDRNLLGMPSDLLGCAALSCPMG